MIVIVLAFPHGSNFFICELICHVAGTMLPRSMAEPGHGAVEDLVVEPGRGKRGMVWGVMKESFPPARVDEGATVEWHWEWYLSKRHAKTKAYAWMLRNHGYDETRAEVGWVTRYSVIQTEKPREDDAAPTLVQRAAVEGCPG